MELPILGLPHLGEHFPTFLATQPVYLLPIPGFRSLHQVIDIRLTRSVANIFQLDALFPACGSIPRIERLLRPENGKKEAPVIRVLWTTWTTGQALSPVARRSTSTEGPPGDVA